MSGSLARMGRPSPSQRVESGSSPARAIDARRYRRATISLAPCRHLSRPIVAGRLRVASIGSPFSGRRAELAGRSRRVPLPQYASVPECLAIIPLYAGLSNCTPCKTLFNHHTWGIPYWQNVPVCQNLNAPRSPAGPAGPTSWRRNPRRGPGPWRRPRPRTRRGLLA
jgi:hypothetical protein